VKQKMLPKYDIKYLNFFSSILSLQSITAGILRGNLTNITAIDLANNLSLYINSITRNNAGNSEDNLEPKLVDEILGKLNSSLTISTTESFIMAQQIDQGRNLSVLGASFKRGSGGDIVSNTKDQMNDSSILVGATVSDRSLDGITSLNILIIDKPIAYEQLGDWDRTKLASSVIVVTVQNPPLSNPTNVSLYFQVLDEYKPKNNPNYSCSYFDTDGSKWSDELCTVPIYNSNSKRYECSCNHLSIFALVWSANITSCNVNTQLLSTNGTCVSKADAQV
jgi:hypothetical protein